MVVKIVFLGTGGYHPNQRRHTAGVLLPDADVLFDAGSGTFRLAEHLTSPKLNIFLSHAHLDHIVGLTFLLVPFAKGLLESVTVYANAATLAAVKNHLFSKPIFPVMPPFEFVELTDSVPVGLAAGVTIRHQPLPSHPGGSRGYRVEWNDKGVQKSLAYITDTAVDGTYHDFIRGADLLIHECYFADDMQDWGERTGHSCTSQVARLAAETGVKRLILTHIDPQHPEDDPIGLTRAKSHYGNIELAEDLMEVEV